VFRQLVFARLTNPAQLSSARKFMLQDLPGIGASGCSTTSSWATLAAIPICLKYRHSDILRAGDLMEAVKVGKRGTIVVPAKLRKRYGIEEGSVVTAEAREDGVLIRPAIVVPVERYTPERKAEFLLCTATTPRDYARARKEVKKLGLDPDAIPHQRLR
jgi:AbrB family looped-hinge helix DNA binding protein